MGNELNCANPFGDYYEEEEEEEEKKKKKEEEEEDKSATTACSSFSSCLESTINITHAARKQEFADAAQ